MAEFTWKLSVREKWIGRHPSLWFSVGRDSHRSAKGNIQQLLYQHLMYFTRDVGILLGGCLTVKTLMARPECNN